MDVNGSSMVTSDSTLIRQAVFGIIVGVSRSHGRQRQRHGERIRLDVDPAKVFAISPCL